MYIWESLVVVLLILTIYCLGTNYINFLLITPFVIFVGYLRKYGFDYYSYYSMFDDADTLKHYVFDEFSIEIFYFFFNNSCSNAPPNLKLGLLFFASFFLRISSIYVFFDSFSTRLLAFLVYLNNHIFLA